MNCSCCGTENPSAARFCLSCASPLILACAKCGTELPPHAKFCFNCAAPVSQQAHIALPPIHEPEPLASLLDGAVKRLVPAEYVKRLSAARGQVAQERRTVTILFSDVVGSTALAQDLDAEDVMEIMAGAFDFLIEPVYRHEGTVARLMGDAVLAFFGAPIAHEDDPERAIRAALEITAGAQRYGEKLERERGLKGLSVRVGIHTGAVVVGEVGSDLRVEYTAMGDAVNLAARMEENAPPGGVLITHDTYRYVQGVFDVLAQEPLLVKGRSEPVRTYLVQRAKPRAFRLPSRGVEGIETRMVGREAELKLLQEVFYAVIEDRELQAVTISGEAGVGKSRLLHEFETWAELLPEQLYYFKARSFPEMQNQPYGLLRDLIVFRFQIQDTDTAAGVRKKLEEGIRTGLGEDEEGGKGPQVALRAHLLGHLVGFQLGDSPYLAEMRDDPLQLRDEALAHLAAHFQAMARQWPVLILLEDLHWADDSSLDALNHLALALKGQAVMTISTVRPELFERRPHWGEGQGFHRSLVLEALSKWDSRQLVADILQKVPEVPQALRDLIVTSAEGNPFFIEESVKMLVEDGVIVKGGEAWQVVPSRLVGVRVPPTLTSVLQARLDRLPLEERTVLQQASVVGRLFWDRAVVHINALAETAMGEAEVMDCLSALRGREMVYQRETSSFADAQEYLFKHTLLREVTYGSVLKRVRRTYHGLVADWLLEQTGERAEEFTSLVAEHLVRAGRAEVAIEYLSHAGDQARGLYAHQEAIRAYERALSLLKEQGCAEQAARTLMKLGLAYHNAFQFQQSRQAYDEASSLWQQVAEAAPALSVAPAPHPLRMVWYSGGTLDPTMELGIAGDWINGQLYCGLFTELPSLDVVPDLARSWAVSEGGRRYVFHLRDDVYWSDGMPVTAGDFEYAWRRVLDPATGSPNAEFLYDILGARAFHQGQISHPGGLGVRAVNDLALEVELEEPTGHLLQLLACTVTFPVPRHVFEAQGESWTELGKVVSNGPFRLEARPSDEFLVLARNPAYHGTSTGNLQRAELSLLLPHQSSLALLEAYEAGELDVFYPWELPHGDRDRVRQRHSGEFILEPWLQTDYLAFNTSRPPFNDARVRQAFALATDREMLASILLKGFVFPATGGFVPPGMAGHLPGIALPHDPERARRLLAEAGYPGGHGLPAIVYLTRTAIVDHESSEYFCQRWREELNVDVKVEAIEFRDYADRLNREPPDILTWCWVADYPDPDNFLRVALSTVPMGWQNQSFIRLVEKARRLTDQQRRIEIYRQADRILVEEAAILPVFYGRNSLLVKPWIRKFPLSPRGGWYLKDVIIESH